MTRRRKTLLIVAAVAVGLCALCLLIALLLPKQPAIPPVRAGSPRPSATEPPVRLPPSATFLPSATLPPATFTPSPVPTSIPTPSATPVCICAYDAYDCTGFATHAEAQACFDDCIRVHAGDIHLLDSDGDGEACESLP